MNNLAIFEEVAAGKLTPEQATKLMLDADATKKRTRPEWAPRWAWACGAIVLTLLLAVIGIERRA